MGEAPGFDARAVDRAAGCLWGHAIGDALGMPTQLLSLAEVRRRYGRVDGFRPGPPDHPIAAGLVAGRVTDDTEQAVLLAELLGPDGVVDELGWAAALLDWEAGVRARGSSDLLGPSTRRALAALAAGEPPETAGRDGVTNGAAMRIAPVAIAVAGQDVPHLVDRVVGASRLTHGTSLGLAAAAAVAGAVSSALDGADMRAAIACGVRAAEVASTRGRWVAGASVARRIVVAIEAVDTAAADAEVDRVLEVVDELVGTSLAANESVPAAFALAARFEDDPWAAVCAAASVGGDTDTIAAIVGAVLGAVHGRGGWPEPAIR